MYVYDYVDRLVLTPRQKQLLLVRFTIIMGKVKRKLGVYSACHTCTGTLLIVGNIMVPSLLSVEAFLFDLEDMRRIVFWIVWALSVVIALVSSFVTFCNTQKIQPVQPVQHQDPPRALVLPHPFGPLHGA